jgi:hypothetical protein
LKRPISQRDKESSGEVRNAYCFSVMRTLPAFGVSFPNSGLLSVDAHVEMMLTIHFNYRLSSCCLDAERSRERLGDFKCEESCCFCCAKRNLQGEELGA